jgi:hypothetical protein
MPKRTKRLPYQRQGHEPRVFDLRSELYRIFGVDLTNVPGISAMTSQTILCEIGTDVSGFRKCFRIRLLAQSVSGKEDQRRKSTLHQEQTSPKPGYRPSIIEPLMNLLEI